ncbi:PHP domain-containing protein [Oxynema sp. CENA135]|uniref:PHP domain-containing protein n=1 Tax=Oxynema sp. CENA135 TaxID=984206 RepID=UPI00190A05A6|nr:PHP domain-containing protein [Oxynema sp. CENA135]MBK4732671.1 PHP domain-containing protein [Oxynema sp. CENA135]
MSVNLTCSAVSFDPSIERHVSDPSQDRGALQEIFQQIDAHSCPRSYNFHMHTTASDGRLSPEALMQQAVDIGLQGLAITDHHSVTGYQIARHWLDRRAQDPRHLAGESADLPQLWSGVEINAGILDIEVHILGYGFDPEHERIQPYLKGYSVRGKDYEAKQVIRAIQSAGGLAVLAHPARYRRRGPTQLIPEVARLGIDGIETYYAYDNPDPWRPSSKQTAQVKRLAQQYELLQTCGTDTHGANLLMRL